MSTQKSTKYLLLPGLQVFSTITATKIDPAMHLAGGHSREAFLGMLDPLRPVLKMERPELTEDQVNELCEKVRENILDPKMRLYADLWDLSIGHANCRHCVIGRKPSEK